MQRTAPVPDDFVHVMPVVKPCLLVAVDMRRCQFRAAHGNCQALEEFVGDARNGYPFAIFLGREVAVWASEIVVRWPVPLAYATEHAIGRRQFFGAAKHRLVQRSVDVLSLAGALAVAQGHQDADTAIEAGQVIAEGGRARGHRRSSRHSREKGDAANGVCDAGKAGTVLVGAGLPITGNAQHDQARVDLAQHLPAESPLLEGAWPEVLAQHIRFLDQPLEQLDAFRQM